jgi:hypothetical protein
VLWDAGVPHLPAAIAEQCREYDEACDQDHVGVRDVEEKTNMMSIAMISTVRITLFGKLTWSCSRV